MKWLRLFFVVVFSCSVVSVFTLFLHNCFNYYDIGIYSDALTRISSGNLNPYIPGRFLHIFNDHFDPILIPISFFTRWIPAPYLGMSVSLLSALCCWFPILLLRKEGKLSDQQASLLYGLFLLSPALLSALHFPFHPTTWAVFPLFTFLACLETKRFGWALVFFSLLCCCKEEFPFLGLTAFVFLWAQRKQRIQALAFLIVGGSFLIFALVIRPRLFGFIQPYGKNLLQSFLQDPAATIGIFLKYEGGRFWSQALIPLLFLLPWGTLKRNLPALLWSLWLVAPILGIRILSGLWFGQYGPVALVAIVFIYVRTTGPVLLSKKRVILCSVVFVVMYSFGEMKYMRQAFATDPHTASRSCPPNPKRLKALTESQQAIARLPQKDILVGHNLCPKQILESPDKNLYDLSNFDRSDMQGKVAVNEFGLVLTEKIPYDSEWDPKYKNIQRMIEIWRHSLDVQVLRDDAFVFFAIGKIRTDL